MWCFFFIFLRFFSHLCYLLLLYCFGHICISTYIHIHFAQNGILSLNTIFFRICESVCCICRFISFFSGISTRAMCFRFHCVFFHPRSLCVERSPVTTHWLYMSIWSNLQNNNGCMCVFHSRHFLLSTFFPVSLFLFWSRWIVCCVCCIPLIILLYLPTHILYWMAFFPFSLLLHFAFCFPCNQAILTSYMSEQKKKKVDMREKRQIVMLPKQVCVSVSPCMLWTISKRYFIYTNIW